mmetsp:Transcript_4611/g.13504  ORF Transcript_4611/g.13504 Transcript_4611/m.13504 type:complete len:205 (-) Transcript_4611:692-1306(-)
MVGGLPTSCLAASVYDTKPVHLISTMHTVCHAVDVVRQYWRPEAGKKVAVVTKRLNIAYDYNFSMGNVDINDQLRGSYRPDAWRRNRKWWWAIYLWTIGTACTNAYKIYTKVCDAHAVVKARRLTHLQFQCKSSSVARRRARILQRQFRACVSLRAKSRRRPPQTPMRRRRCRPLAATRSRAGSRRQAGTLPSGPTGSRPQSIN